MDIINNLADPIMTMYFYLYDLLDYRIIYFPAC